MQETGTIDANQDDGLRRSEIKGKAVWVAGAVVALIAAIVVVVIAGWLAIRQAPRPMLGSNAPNITAFGRLFLIDSDYNRSSVDCRGSGAVADIRPGAEITVTAGRSIARTGKVVGGVVYDDGACTFSWAVRNVPTGYSQYHVSMAGHGAVDVKQADLAKEIPLWIDASSGELSATHPADTVPDFFKMVVGTLILVDDGGSFEFGRPCTGTGLNADIVSGAPVLLSQGGVMLDTSQLAGGTGTGDQECRFAFFLLPQTMSRERTFTLSVAGHGSVEVQPQPVGVGAQLLAVLFLDESGRLTSCDNIGNGTFQC